MDPQINGKENHPDTDVTNTVEWQENIGNSVEKVQEILLQTLLAKLDMHKHIVFKF